MRSITTPELGDPGTRGSEPVTGEPVPAAAEASTSPAAGPIPAIPPTMAAVVQDRYGNPEVLEVSEVVVPEPGSDEVLVRVAAAGLSRGTWHLMTGTPYLMRVLGFGLRAPKERVLGQDVAGTVVAVGASVTRFSVGDEVYGIGRGSFADFAVAAEDKLAPMPVAVDAAAAAVVPVSGLTAIQALRDAGGLQAGQHVLVLGASGGVGSFAVQIAKALGAEVTGVCRGSKVDLVRALGADHVIDYEREDPTDGRQRYDLILDIGGNRRVRHLRRALTTEGTLVIVGGESGGRVTGGIGRQLRAALRSPFVRHRLTMVIAKEHHADLEVLTEMIDAGLVVPAVERSFPLAGVPDALRRLEAGEVRGKIAIVV